MNYSQWNTGGPVTVRACAFYGLRGAPNAHFVTARPRHVRDVGSNRWYEKREKEKKEREKLQLHLFFIRGIRQFDPFCANQSIKIS